MQEQFTVNLKCDSSICSDKIGPINQIYVKVSFIRSEEPNWKYSLRSSYHKQQYCLTNGIISCSFIVM